MKNSCNKEYNIACFESEQKDLHSIILNHILYCSCFFCLSIIFSSEYSIEWVSAQMCEQRFSYMGSRTALCSDIEDDESSEKRWASSFFAAILWFSALAFSQKRISVADFSDYISFSIHRCAFILCFSSSFISQSGFSSDFIQNTSACFISLLHHIHTDAASGWSYSALFTDWNAGSAGNVCISVGIILSCKGLYRKRVHSVQQKRLETLWNQFPSVSD